MNASRYALTVHGKQKEWEFEIYAPPEYVHDWEQDGLIVHELIYIVPTWWVDRLRLPHWFYGWIEHLFNFRRRLSYPKDSYYLHLLKQTEWITYGTSEPWCPHCKSTKQRGHLNRCPMKEL